MRVDKEPHELLSGEYSKWKEDGNWYGMPPGTDHLANLSKHEIIEHDDGTITVQPSILVGGYDENLGCWSEWHGYLTKGKWLELCG